MKQICITCPQCEGKGRVGLPNSLSDTLAMIPKNGARCAEELAQKSIEDIGVTAWSNRLVNLLMLGLVKRERDGKYWRYSRATPHSPQGEVAEELAAAK